MTQLEAVAPQTLPRSAITLGQKAALWAIDMVVVLGFVFLYFLGRGAPPDRVEMSTRNAFYIIDLEKSLGIFHEASWQQAMIENERLVRLANFVYLDMHLPFLVVLALAFFLADPRKHRVIRNTILLSAFMAIPIYYLFPVTPPRLMSSAGYPLGIWDTIPDTVRDKPGALANWYAAVPSYHFGWIALAMGGVWWCWKNWIVRGLAIAFAALMWWSIVVTGNHYFLDMVAGVIMVSIALYFVLKFERWADANPKKVEKFTVRVGQLRLPF